MEKTCIRCGGTFPEEIFERKPRNGKIYSNVCKPCCRKSFNENREKNPKKYKDKDKRYYDNNKETVIARRKQFAIENPEKIGAQQKVRNAIKKGNLIRPKNCDSCGVTCKPDAHHCDYNRPLDVVWLCRKCHMGLHHKK